MASPIETYRAWRRLQPDIGCQFARVLSIHPKRWGQIFEVVPQASTSAGIAASLAARVDAHVADGSVTAAALLMPYLSTLQETARVVLGLNSHDGWSVTTSLINNEVVGQIAAIRAVRQIPFGAASCPSESLVLGNFPEFPPTRRSPVTAMEIFVGKPLAYDPKTGKPTTQANLAHIIEKDVYGAGPFDVVWGQSENGREKSLGRKDDNRAKAKVTLVVPVAMARQLGCIQ